MALLRPRLVAVAVIAATLAGSCAIVGGGGGEHEYRADFTRAIQLFPGGKVRILGVDVGHVTEVEPKGAGVTVSFTVSDDHKLPADVSAAIVPASLLGERYIQLLPAYQGGPTLEPGATIPVSRTAVPAEPDELLRSLQDYLGSLDPDTVTRFVTQAARLLQGNGTELNALINHAASVIGTLAAKRDDLAQIIVEFEKLTDALSTRQRSIGSLIRSYNAVAGTLALNRSALEGTVDGLNQAAIQLASLLLAHREPLKADVESLARTGSTVRANVGALARTGHWAERLFRAASRAVDYNHDWLRLNNQGQELAAMIVLRLRQRFVELCHDLGLPECDSPIYWAQRVPTLFCFAKVCPGAGETKNAQQEIVDELSSALEQIPTLLEKLLMRAREITCADADDRAKCVKRKTILIKCLTGEHPQSCLKKKALLLKCLKQDDVQACLDKHKDDEVEDLVKDLLDDTLDPGDLLGGTGP